MTDPSTNSSSECATDGVCYADLWRNRSGLVERRMSCFNREQLVQNPFLCQEQPSTRYVIACCSTNYCNRHLMLELLPLDDAHGRVAVTRWRFRGDVKFLPLAEKDVWRFRGSGDVQFLPLAEKDVPALAEITFSFNATKPEGTIMCTRNDDSVLNVDLKDSHIWISIFDVDSKRRIETVICRANPPQMSYIDQKWHRVQLSMNAGQLSVVCDDNQSPISFSRRHHVPFANTKYGLFFGRNCVDERVSTTFNGMYSCHVFELCESKFCVCAYK